MKLQKLKNTKVLLVVLFATLVVFILLFYIFTLEDTKRFRGDSFSFTYPSAWRVTDTGNQIIINPPGEEYDLVVSSEDTKANDSIQKTTVTLSKNPLGSLVSEIRASTSDICTSVEEEYSKEEYTLYRDDSQIVFDSVDVFGFDACLVNWTFNISFGNVQVPMQLLKYYIVNDTDIFTVEINSSGNDDGHFQRARDIVDSVNLL